MPAESIQDTTASAIHLWGMRDVFTPSKSQNPLFGAKIFRVIFETKWFHLGVMIEVFKTNVEDRHHADELVEQIQLTCGDYEANFDLEDCDRILRVRAVKGKVETAQLIRLLNDFGFHAEVLSDECPRKR